jgi:hypothetical protein
MKQAYTICYEKGGVEVQRYTISALNQAAAETEADNRFQRAHPELKVPDDSVSRRVEAH